METTIQLPLAIAAVDWWANFIEKPAIGDQHNGDVAGFESVLMSFAKTSIRNNTEQGNIDLFKQSLYESIAKQYDFAEKFDRSITVSTDWFPEMELAEACRAGNITGTEFPSKTMMWINPKKGTVTVGIGNREIETIFPEK